MPFPTKPAFVWTPGRWSEVTRQHPALKFLEEYTLDFDAGNHAETKWFTEDFFLCKADGTEIHGRDKAIAAIQELYAPFVAQLHQPSFSAVTETDDGWELIGRGHIFANLPGSPSPDEKKASDASGKQWDISVPAAFHFQFVKADGGILLKAEHVMADSGPIMTTMLKRGLIGPKDLGF